MAEQTEGSITINASATLTVGGVTMTRDTDPNTAPTAGPGGTGSATKFFEDLNTTVANTTVTIGSGVKLGNGSGERDGRGMGTVGDGEGVGVGIGGVGTDEGKGDGEGAGPGIPPPGLDGDDDGAPVAGTRTRRE